jgi:hypothetical protein
VGPERGPLSLESGTEELPERKSGGSGLEILENGRRGSAALTTRHPTNFADNRRPLGLYSLLADSGYGVLFVC